LAFTALLQCKKEILLSANVSSAHIAEIRTAQAVPLMTDQVLSNDSEGKNIFYIPDLLRVIPGEKTALHDEIPLINSDETSIVVFTSESTGNPRAVKQRLTEFELDNKFILSKWGEEILSRKVCSTVSPLHIYGLLFSILLPFTAGVPFRRERIRIPEELEKFSDTEYMIITVPAFLYRAVEVEKPGLNLKSPWIFCFDGVLDRETAEKTAEVFGFWPVEVYGSTETSGFAFRQSDKGPEWAPFDNALLPETASSAPAGFRSLDGVRVIDRAENSVALEFSVPGTSPYFDGHFPGFPILPAVAQAELVLRFASEYFGTGVGVSEIKRIKFLNLVRPGTLLLLRLEKGDKNIFFKITSPDGEMIYASGAFVL
jgi:3-hydroxymyristoyl/3-hydroxydecanoyl-(acyl carrier protein) dehydratase